MSDLGIEQMVGLTFVEVLNCVEGSERVMFQAESGRKFVFYHSQDCCEHVSVAQVDGDPGDLLGSPLVMAEEATERKEPDGESETWTFYKFATVKGYVTVRWVGRSNGYYSETVQLSDDPEAV